jgi:hypothetical protein
VASRRSGRFRPEWVRYGNRTWPPQCHRCKYIPARLITCWGWMSACQIIRHGAKTCVLEYSEFIQSGMIDEINIAKAVDRTLGMVGIRDDCHSDTDLRGWIFGHPVWNTTKRKVNARPRPLLDRCRVVETSSLLLGRAYQVSFNIFV